MKVKSLSRVWLFATPWKVAYKALQLGEFSRQEYWSGLPFPSPGELPNPGIEPGSPALQAYTLLSEPPGKPRWMRFIYIYIVISVNSTEISYKEGKARGCPPPLERELRLWDQQPSPGLTNPEQPQPWNFHKKQASGTWGEKQECQEEQGSVWSTSQQAPMPNHNTHVWVWDIIFILDAFHMAPLPRASSIQRIREQGETWGAQGPQKSLETRFLA